MIEENTNLKILHLLNILTTESDEDNILSMNQIITKLENNGVVAERKAISRYIKQLIDFGYDISIYEENRKGYYRRERDFEALEIKLLIDAVISSKYITKKKSMELIKKLQSLTSVNIAKRLENQVYILDGVKSSNEEIYYNVDKIDRAIDDNKKISFQYYDYDFNKKKVLRRRGHVYELSPYSCAWREGFYYLIGNHDKYEDFTHYRIDRMCNIEVLDAPRKNIEEVSDYKNGLNTADYMKKTFKMFTGELGRVEIKFRNTLLNTIIDEFGENVCLRKLDEECFKISSEVNIGEGLIYWVLQFGPDAEVLAPDNLRNSIKEKIDLLKNIYK